MLLCCANLSFYFKTGTPAGKERYYTRSPRFKVRTYQVRAGFSTFTVQLSIFVRHCGRLQAFPTDGATEAGFMPGLQ